MVDLRVPTPLLTRLRVLRPGSGPPTAVTGSARSPALTSDRKWAAGLVPQRSLRKQTRRGSAALDDAVCRVNFVPGISSGMTRSMAVGAVSETASGEERARDRDISFVTHDVQDPKPCSHFSASKDDPFAASNGVSRGGEGRPLLTAEVDDERLQKLESDRISSVPEDTAGGATTWLPWTVREDDEAKVCGAVSAKRPRKVEGGIAAMGETERRIGAAWDHWKKLGQPKFHVAPMVDQSELPFRMLCRKYGAKAAYTPMLHSRLFAQQPKYRASEFTTCPEDRPLFVQFCANNPDTLLEAARLVAPDCDFVDINLGCPQGIAKKGNYGAFLMENLPLIESLVSKLASNLSVPVSCKIRVFPELEKTLRYARMLEEAGCSLLAVHGRTRDQKNGKLVRADWDAIKAVKAALRIPVLANGNIRCLDDVHACMDYTGVDGVMSAESLLENPSLFSGFLTAHADVSESASGSPTGSGKAAGEAPRTIDERVLMMEYLDLCKQYPVPMRMVRGHVHKILGKFWFRRYPEIREQLNKQSKLTLEWLRGMMERLMALTPCDESRPEVQVRGLIENG